MLFLFSLIFISIILSVLIFLWSLKKTLLNFKRDNLTSYECGYDNMGSARVPFSTRFFLLTVIFLVFDIEIVIIMIMPIMLMMNSYMHTLSMMLFLLLLLMGTMHELKEGSLDWTK